MHQTPNSNNDIRAMGFHILNFDLEKVLNELEASRCTDIVWWYKVKEMNIRSLLTGYHMFCSLIPPMSQ